MTDIAEFTDPGEPPVLDWIDKTLIDADPHYQRPLDANRVKTILKDFTWRSFGALVLVPQPTGRFHATDGQHRLEAAKLHPKVTHVPAALVKAEDMRGEATIFVDINANRKNVSSLELFFARLAADDEDADTIRQVCERAGIRVPKYASAGFKVNDSVAVGAMQALIGRRGAMRAREYLSVLVDCGFAPITAAHIKAVEYVMTDPEFRGQVELADLGVAIKTIGATADVEAKRFAATHRVPVWRGLANVWFQKSKKVRRSATPASSPELKAPSSRPAAVTPVGSRLVPPVRPVSSHPTATGRAFGDPEPGRSALDQRRQA